MRPNRIKKYGFTETGSLVSHASNGRFDVYSEYPINGTIQKVEFLGGNFSANGSILITISGTGESIWLKEGTANAASVVYPIVYPIEPTGTTGSPRFVQQVINGVVRIVGSGLGNSKSGLGINIIYI